MRAADRGLLALVAMAACGRSSATGPAEKPVTQYYDDGKKAAEGLTRGDLREGDWRFWDENGEVMSEGTYVDSVKQGSWMESEYDGSVGEWVRARGTRDGGKREGMWQTRAVSGWLVSEIEWQDDQMNGSYRVYYRNGHPREEGTWHDNIATGHWSSWYENGQQHLDRTLDDAGHEIGTTTAWYENGALQYRVDQTTGTTSRWLLDGGIDRGSPR